MRRNGAQVLMECLESRELFSHTTPDIVKTYKGTTKGKTTGEFTIHVTGQSSRGVVYGSVTDILDGVSYTDTLGGRISGDAINLTFSGGATGTLVGTVSSRHRVFTLSGTFDNKTLKSTGTFSVST